MTIEFLSRISKSLNGMVLYTEISSRPRALIKHLLVIVGITIFLQSAAGEASSRSFDIMKELPISWVGATFQRGHECNHLLSAEGRCRWSGYDSQIIQNNITFLRGKTTAKPKTAFDSAIYQPFWMSWWFPAIVLFAVTGSVYALLRFKNQQLNQEILREVLRRLLQLINGSKKYVILNDGKGSLKIQSSSIAYIKSAGNYIEIHHEKGTSVIRHTIGSFLTEVPDPLEYVRIHRCYIVRIDRVERKGRKEVEVLGTKIPVGTTYSEQLKYIKL